MGKVTGLKSLQDTLRKKLRKAGAGTTGGKASVIVGYTQQYAIFVHEDLTAAHPVGNAKFLEAPFRRLAPSVPGIVKAVIAKGGTLPQGLMVAGLRLQRESQQEVPVDTGALKGSAFTRKVK